MFIFGPTGVGKTHLIQAIGIGMKEENPDLRVLYLSARTFESQYTTAVRNNKVNDFINFYQSIDMLIMDDVQEFAGKTATQNTFFHIFNHLHNKQRHLILSCDCPPSELDGMEPRLLSRFKWGMTVELSSPDYELRRNVFLKKLFRPVSKFRKTLWTMWQRM
ncbi:MAG: DnaA/Hda family protein [Bacteroidales bacterium]|nr:MAG: DnaA/Hda family protein [Bacteroidales bacterium]